MLSTRIVVLVGFVLLLFTTAIDASDNELPEAYDKLYATVFNDPTAAEYRTRAVANALKGSNVLVFCGLCGTNVDPCEIGGRCRGSNTERYFQPQPGFTAEFVENVTTEVQQTLGDAAGEVFFLSGAEFMGRFASAILCNAIDDWDIKTVVGYYVDPASFLDIAAQRSMVSFNFAYVHHLDRLPDQVPRNVQLAVVGAERVGFVAGAFGAELVAAQLARAVSKQMTIIAGSLDLFESHTIQGMLNGIAMFCPTCGVDVLSGPEAIASHLASLAHHRSLSSLVLTVNRGVLAGYYVTARNELKCHPFGPVLDCPRVLAIDDPFAFERLWNSSNTSASQSMIGSISNAILTDFVDMFGDHLREVQASKAENGGRVVLAKQFVSAPSGVGEIIQECVFSCDAFPTLRNQTAALKDPRTRTSLRNLIDPATLFDTHTGLQPLLGVTRRAARRQLVPVKDEQAIYPYQAGAVTGKLHIEFRFPATVTINSLVFVYDMCSPHELFPPDSVLASGRIFAFSPELMKLTSVAANAALLDGFASPIDLSASQANLSSYRSTLPLPRALMALASTSDGSKAVMWGGVLVQRNTTTETCSVRTSPTSFASSSEVWVGTTSTRGAMDLVWEERKALPANFLGPGAVGAALSAGENASVMYLYGGMSSPDDRDDALFRINLGGGSDVDDDIPADEVRVEKVPPKAGWQARRRGGHALMTVTGTIGWIEEYFARETNGANGDDEIQFGDHRGQPESDTALQSPVRPSCNDSATSDPTESTRTYLVAIGGQKPEDKNDNRDGASTDEKKAEVFSIFDTRRERWMDVVIEKPPVGWRGYDNDPVPPLVAGEPVTFSFVGNTLTSRVYSSLVDLRIFAEMQGGCWKSLDNDRLIFTSTYDPLHSLAATNSQPRPERIAALFSLKRRQWQLLEDAFPFSLTGYTARMPATQDLSSYNSLLYATERRDMCTVVEEGRETDTSDRTWRVIFLTLQSIAPDPRVMLFEKKFSCGVSSIPSLRGDECLQCAIGTYHGAHETCEPCGENPPAEVQRSGLCVNAVEEVAEESYSWVFALLLVLLMGLFGARMAHKAHLKSRRAIGRDELAKKVAEAAGSMEPNRTDDLRTEVEKDNTFVGAMLDISELIDVYHQFMPPWLRLAQEVAGVRTKNRAASGATTAGTDSTSEVTPAGNNSSQQFTAAHSVHSARPRRLSGTFRTSQSGARLDQNFSTVAIPDVYNRGTSNPNWTTTTSPPLPPIYQNSTTMQASQSGIHGNRSISRSDIFGAAGSRSHMYAASTSNIQSASGYPSLPNANVQAPALFKEWRHHFGNSLVNNLERRRVALVVLENSTPAFLPPANLNDMCTIASYFLEAVTEMALRYRGNIEQLLGDGAMMCFNGLTPCIDPEATALRAACETVFFRENYIHELSLAKQMDNSLSQSVNAPPNLKSGDDGENWNGVEPLVPIFPSLVITAAIGAGECCVGLVGKAFGKTSVVIGAPVVQATHLHSLCVSSGARLVMTRDTAARAARQITWAMHSVHSDTVSNPRDQGDPMNRPHMGSSLANDSFRMPPNQEEEEGIVNFGLGFNGRNQDTFQGDGALFDHLQQSIDGVVPRLMGLYFTPTGDGTRPTAQHIVEVSSLWALCDEYILRMSSRKHRETENLRQLSAVHFSTSESMTMMAARPLDLTGLAEAVRGDIASSSSPNSTQVASPSHPTASVSATVGLGIGGVSSVSPVGSSVDTRAVGMEIAREALMGLRRSKNHAQKVLAAYAEYNRTYERVTQGVMNESESIQLKQTLFPELGSRAIARGARNGIDGALHPLHARQLQQILTLREIPLLTGRLLPGLVNASGTSTSTPLI